jgi:hypothetical protein
LFKIHTARNDVQPNASLGQLIKGSDSASRLGWVHETRSMRHKEPYAVGSLGGMHGDKKPVRRRRGVPDEDRIETGVFMRLGKFDDVLRIDAAANDMDRGIRPRPLDADHSKHVHGHGKLPNLAFYSTDFLITESQPG